ncbi:glycoside hydrolase family 2 TIM barrel-domain containing protein [Microbacterium aoyamense]|uniref:Glycoside hydrolase family 2 TIM barrel-domain containing protein n=1 Tax=Microbacterium aoyamense TaxID=344166 RepID=A0ABN2PF99_9MICO|nr:glycoside hydrolase family 2 TIM barrel-domain containing protein [Microbacterium aoyamense]
MLRQPFHDDWFVETLTPGRRTRPAGPLTLPHDAMMYEIRQPDCANAHNTGYFPGGRYRYTKRFTAPEEWRDRCVLLEFEGVYQRSQVLLNGRSIGGRPSGYAEFRVPLTHELVIGGENLIEVVVDNADEPNSRWYTGSGIYRPVHILTGPELRIGPAGPRARTVSIDGADATVEIRIPLENSANRALHARVRAVLSGPDGRRTQTSSELTATPGSCEVIHMVRIENALVWSPDTPALYDIDARIETLEGEVDASQDRFGIRTIDVDSLYGLRINGVSVKLRGAAIHHDNGVIGAHTLEAAERRRVRILKESGFNAIRSAHNPASRALLRACDEMGMLVMDELADAWTRPKVNFDSSLEFPQWWEADLEAMIEKDFNHPSVIMYSIGNEIGETATPAGVETSRTLAGRARTLDPSRPVTNCINAFLNLVAPADEQKVQSKAAAARAAGRQEANKNLILLLNLMMGAMTKIMPRLLKLRAVDMKTRDAFATVDVAGYNYMASRFRGDARLHPSRVMVGSEDPATQTVAIWRDIADQPHVIGDFVWTGWDYLGEGGLATIRYNDRARLYQPYPALAAGTPNIDITGHRQTQSYLNEIAWGLRAGPHLAVQPVNRSGEKQTISSWRSTSSLQSWSWEGYEGRNAVVEVYADADHVELRLNGVTLGRERSGASVGYLSTFRVPYEPGELVAISFDSNGAELGSTSLRTASEELSLRMTAETTTLRADGQDLAFVTVEVTDSAGTVRPLADRLVKIDVDGPATLLGLGSGEAITEEVFTSSEHSTYFGRVLAVVRAGSREGSVRVTATAEGCEPQYVDLPVTGDAHAA